MGRIDVTKMVQKAREMAKAARLEMFASFAELQLDVQATHNMNWDSLRVRQLEDNIDQFKDACQKYRSAEDGIIKAMSMGSDRMDSAVPSPNELHGDVPPGWKSEMQDGVPVLVPEAPTVDNKA